MKVEGIEIEKAKQRLVAHTIFTKSNKGVPMLEQDYEGLKEKCEGTEEKGRVLEKLAKKVGLSKGTIYKAKKIKEEAEKDPEIKDEWEQAKKGEKKKGKKKKTINSIFNSIDHHNYIPYQFH